PAVSCLREACEIDDEPAADAALPRPFLDEDVLEIEPGPSLPGGVSREEEREARGSIADEGEPYLEAGRLPESVAQQIGLSGAHRIGLALISGERAHEVQHQADIRRRPGTDRHSIHRAHLIARCRRARAAANRSRRARTRQSPWR